MEREIDTLVRIIASEGRLRPRDLIKSFGIRADSVSKIIARLRNKGLIDRKDKRVILADAEPAESFKKLYYAHRAVPFNSILAQRRTDLLSRLNQTPKSVYELTMETGLPNKTVYYYLKYFLSLGIVKRNKSGRVNLYSINSEFWGELKDFVTTLQDYQDKRLIQLVPREALLIRSYPNSVLFKSSKPLDATLTSFSAYGQFDIALRLRDNYYTLPKRHLSIGEIFLHSLDSADDFSRKLFCILFYLKNRNELENIEHPILKDIRTVLQGETIKGYPSLEEIRDRTELYGIKF